MNYLREIIVTKIFCDNNVTMCTFLRLTNFYQKTSLYKIDKIAKSKNEIILKIK